MVFPCSFTPTCPFLLPVILKSAVISRIKSKIEKEKWQQRELNGGNQITSPVQWHVIPKVA